MEPELQKNDYVVVSRIAYFFGLSSKLPLFNIRIKNNLKLWYKTPKNGDIIMIDNNIPSLAKYNEKFLIKRISASSGDIIYYQTDIFSNISYSLVKSYNYSDEFRKVIIPSAGETITINFTNYHFYEKLIKNEGGMFEFRGHDIYINNVHTNKYTFKYNHFFVTGDNKLNSFDSRVFGLIPETAIQGKALFIYWSNYSGKTGIFDRFFKWLK
jgi:signal peptidase I